MFLQPQRRNFRKHRKGRLKTKVGHDRVNLRLRATRYSLKYGDFGLMSKEAARLTARQIEAGRRTITRSLRRKGRLWIRAFPDIPVTSKPSDSRMGKGKGAVSFWTNALQPGQLIYELNGVNSEEATRALKAASKKLAFPTQIVSRLQPKKEALSETN